MKSYQKASALFPSAAMAWSASSKTSSFPASMDAPIRIRSPTTERRSTRGVARKGHASVRSSAATSLLRPRCSWTISPPFTSFHQKALNSSCRSNTVSNRVLLFSAASTITSSCSMWRHRSPSVMQSLSSASSRKLREPRLDVQCVSLASKAITRFHH